jgi:rubrerythrin
LIDQPGTWPSLGGDHSWDDLVEELHRAMAKLVRMQRGISPIQDLISKEETGMALLTGDEIIEIATHLEESGEAFYNAAAERATTADIKALFQDLAVQEQYHRQAFQQMGRGGVELALSPEQWDEFQAYTDALLRQSFFAKPENALNLAAGAQDEREALKAALDFEKEAMLFFHELQNAVRGPGQQTVERIIQEEKQHVQRLSGMLAAA